MARKDRVIIAVDKNFFDNIFEPERRKLEKKLGVSVSQPSFTRFLAMKKAKFTIPKKDLNLKINPINMKNISPFPIRKKRGKFNIL